MKVFIASSASQLIDDKYLKLAKDCSDYLVSKNYDLVFGGASFSMMGECYNSFANSNKNIEAFTVDIYKNDLNELDKADCYVVDDTLIRFKKMYDLANVILILPGGIGTLAEFTSALEEYRSQDVNKLIIVYNYEGFYDNIISWMKDNVESKFLADNIFDSFKIVNNMDEFARVVDSFKEDNNE